MKNPHDRMSACVIIAIPSLILKFVQGRSAQSHRSELARASPTKSSGNQLGGPMDIVLSPDAEAVEGYDRSRGSEHVIRTHAFGLHADHLKALAAGRIRVVQVEAFANETACDVISKGQVDLGFKPYINVDQVRRIGMAFYETENQPDLIEDYFRIARENQNAFRSACQPLGSPLDTLRCLLDEIWQPGANLQTIYGRKMFVGLSRMVEPNTTFLAHHDIFAEDAPGREEAESLLAQFAANIYFEVPERGGELLMWHRGMSTEEFDERRKGQYGIEIHDLPPPDVVVKPGRGDLLIFDSRKIHAVASPRDRARVAVSFFIGYRGDDQPLTYWS
ncbi:2OG-Fe(II) oxygenase [Salinarimonas sp. NSM]|uniref:2OG-Fe(II) oxygenase n=1 Tax=Salinarimonas sp. NSM TaxID=3458003 RepID=UPI004035AD1A